MHKTAGHTGDGFSGANQTRKEETRKDFPPTPQSEAMKVADAPGVGDQKEAATGGDERYLAAVADLTSHMQWQPHAATKRKLADILKQLVPDPQQLPDIVDRSCGWTTRPDKLSSSAFRGRVRTLKKQIDTGVTPLHRKGWLTRVEASPYGHEHVTTLDEIHAHGGWGYETGGSA